MRLRRAVAGSIVSALALGGGAVALGGAAPAGAETVPEPAAETTGCRFGTWPDAVQGRPASLAPGAATGLYLWHDQHGWHAFVTHPGHDEVTFRIVVRSTGTVHGVGRRTEHGDAVIERDDNSTVALVAHNYGYLDGMAFRTSCSSAISVSGSIDGQPLTADQVFVGADGAHPDQVPVVIRRSAT